MPIVILTEKPDVGSKVAAALDAIMLPGGKKITFSALKSSQNAVKTEQNKTGYLKIRFQGKECFVTWGIGHLVELMQASDYNPEYKNWRKLPLPFYPEDHMLKIKTIKTTTDSDTKFAERIKKQFSTISELFKKADLIYNATDLDREGEVIFSYIYELAMKGARNKPKIMRACFASQTQQGIIDGFVNAVPGSKMRNLELAGRTRAKADLGVGATMTVAVTLQHPKSGTLSIGRVQTPTLAMIVSRELDIRNFKSTPYWSLEAEFTTPDDETYSGAKKERIETKTEAERLLRQVQGKTGTVTDVQIKRVEKSVPHLYSLSSLQMDANSKYGFTLKRTLDAAQRLYDEGYTTYPRTNSQYLTEDMEPVVNKILDTLSLNPEYGKLINGKPRYYDRPHWFDDKKVESHYAIIPTENVPSELSSDDQKIYDLICRSVIRMLYGPATLLNTKAITTVNGIDFSSNGTTIEEPGWMTVGDAAKVELLPNLKRGMICLGEYVVKEKKTEAPKHYTDKTLLGAMVTAGKLVEDDALASILEKSQNKGIGTEATRAEIIETLLQRDYIFRDGKKICATDKGISLIQNLPVEALKSPSMTAEWEQRLQNIEHGTETPVAFERDIKAALSEWVEQVRGGAKTSYSTATSFKVNCPKCGKPMAEYKWGYGCTGYKDGCRFTIGTLCGKKISPTEVIRLITTGSTNKISGFTSSKGSKFSARLVLQDDKSVKFDFK